MASIDPVAYVRTVPPFDALPQSLFDEAARSLEVAYYPAGTRIVREGGEPLQHLYIIRKGAVRLERGGQTLQMLEEGEIFGYTSLITRQATLDGIVEDDLLAYRLPDAQFQRLLSDARFAGHFAVGLSERLKASLEHSPVALFQADFAAEVQQLVRRPPVWVGPDVTVGEAAVVMRQERISSVLVRTEPPGIVTDRDFRNRVLAEGLGPDAPVTRVFSRPLRTVAAATPLYEAWSALLDVGAHHLPVTRDGEIVGVLSATDLLRHSAQGPMAVLRRVEHLAARDAVPGYGKMLTEMASALLSGGLDALAIAGYVARLNDALLRRLLRFAEGDLGPPPAPYAWVVMGSEGRMEQTLLTDQDNALVYADEGEAQRDWYQRLADRVNADLEAAGFPPCPAGRMARAWHGTVSEWVRRIHDEAEKRPAVAGMLFDLRRAGGHLGLEPLEAALSEAAKKPLFVRRLAKSALEVSPPHTLLLRLRGESSTVDLKAQGISPVVWLARCYAVEAGAPARNTLERLDAAVRAGIMAETLRSNVAEAYRFLLGLRLRLHLRLLADGAPTTDKVALSQLTGIERSRLKDSFRAIKGWQDMAAYRYQPNLL
jgi:CBS domain-containing protein